jgi:hypothetical protein
MYETDVRAERPSIDAALSACVLSRNVIEAPDLLLNRLSLTATSRG